MATPWYSDGLHFTCKGAECGDCCSGRWGSGYVWVNTEEMQRLASHLGLAFEDFTKRYVRGVGDRHSLIEKRNLDCVFYKEGFGCTVYDARPMQCRTYPFWPENLTDREAWEGTAQACPGIGCASSCERHSAKTIDKLKADAVTGGKR